MRVPVIVAAAAAFVGSGFLFTHQSSPGVAAETKYCDGPKVTWRTSLWGNRRSVTEGIEYVSKAANDRTCGNFNIQLYYGEQLSKSRENLDSIKVGAVQAAQVCASYHPAKVRPLGVLDLPFLPVANLDVLQEVFEVMYAQESFKKALADWGAMYYAGTVLPQYEYMGRGKPPMTLEDWKGKRVRALGGMGAAMQALGAVPTTVPAPETYTALQRGTIDAIGFPFSYTFASYKLDEIGEWYTTNMSAGSVGCIFAFSIDAY
jgi:TRAP-type C4-dicarboxylate transport system substrate-binding protein